MGKSTPSAPAVPDPVATAAAQGAENRETAIANAALNRINQITPYGNISYTQTGYDDKADVPLYTQTTTFSPEQQALYDLNQQFNVRSGTVANEQLNRLQSALSTPVSYEGAPALMTGADEATRQAAEDSIMARLNPQFDRDRAALESRLASQGIAMGSGAYNEAMDQTNRSVNDARSQAALQAINLGMAQSQAQNAARQQYVQEASSIRNQPLNEISALISGTQVSSPQFNAVPSVNVAQTPLAQSIYNSYAGQMNQYNQQVAQSNAAMGGMFGLGSGLLSAGGSFLGTEAGAAALLALSDRRLKKNIKKIGKYRGFSLYRFKYLWDDLFSIGFIAQEVEKKRPDAIVDIDGYKAINYGVLI